MSVDAQSQPSAFLHEDVVSNVLNRLPVKSICRFKCVCKTWLSIISAQSFVDSHSARSKSNPNLLVTVCRDKSRYVFIADLSTEQQSLVLSQSVTMPVKYSMFSYISPGDSQSVEGLMFSLCSKELIRIANPSINKCAVFSPVFPRSSHEKTYLYVSLGFDPVEGKHKLLESISILGRNDEKVERTDHCVVTIGDDMSCCRYVKDGPTINRGQNAPQICVNGVIYSKAVINWPSGGIDGWKYCMVAFDVRTESFQAVKFSIQGRFNHNPYPWMFVEFEGKVAIVDYPLSNRDCCYENCEHALELWVLEDFQNQVWSLKFAALPPLPMKMDDMNYPKHRLVGTTLDGELIFAIFEGGDDFSNSHYDAMIQNVSEETCVALSFLFFDMKTGDFRSSKVCLPEGFALSGEVKIMAMGHVEKLVCIDDEEKLKVVVRAEEELEAEMKKMRVQFEEWRKAALTFDFSFHPSLDFHFVQNLDIAASVLAGGRDDEEKLEVVKEKRVENEQLMSVVLNSPERFEKMRMLGMAEKK